MNPFLDFLNSINPVANWTGIEKAASLPKRTMYKHFSGAQPLPAKHISAIVRALCAAYGTIEIDGWRITCDPDGPAIFATKPIPGRDVQCLEPEPGVFEYLAPEWREVFDDFDFSTYFGK